MNKKDVHVFVVLVIAGGLSCFTALVYNSPQHIKENIKMCLEVKLRACAVLTAYDFKSALKKITKSSVSHLISNMV